MTRPDRDSWFPEGLPKIPNVRLVEKIDKGGMGCVYRGTQPSLDRDVAVKILSQELVGDEFQARFQREAKLLAQIDHPAIPTCYDTGVAEGRYFYLVMEFIDGPNLHSWVQERGPLSVLNALELCRAVADALDHALTKNIIHRDVKPKNVLLTRRARCPAGAFEWRPKLCDLGLARRMKRKDEGQSMRTAPGVVMGTPSTMSPEQFKDPDNVDYRADIYGLGCVLYHGLVGKAAFPADWHEAIVAKSGPAPDPCESDPAIRRDVGRVVTKMLARAPFDRHNDYTELLAEFDDLIATEKRHLGHASRVQDGGGASVAGAGGADARTRADPDAPTRMDPGARTLPEGDAGTMVDPAARDGGARRKRGAGTAVAQPWYRKRAFLGSAAAVPVLAVAAIVMTGGSDPDNGNGNESNGGPTPPVVKVAFSDLKAEPDPIDLGKPGRLTASVSHPGGAELDLRWRVERGPKSVQLFDADKTIAGFTILDGIDRGIVMFQLVANGQPSDTVPVTISADPPEPLFLPKAAFAALERHWDSARIRGNWPTQQMDSTAPVVVRGITKLKSGDDDPEEFAWIWMRANDQGGRRILGSDWRLSGVIPVPEHTDGESADERALEAGLIFSFDTVTKKELRFDGIVFAVRFDKYPGTSHRAIVYRADINQVGEWTRTGEILDEFAYSPSTDGSSMPGVEAPLSFTITCAFEEPKPTLTIRLVGPDSQTTKLFNVPHPAEGRSSVDDTLLRMFVQRRPESEFGMAEFFGFKIE